VRRLAQAGKIVTHALPVRIVADRQDVTRAKIGRKIERRAEHAHLGMRHQPNGFDVENSHPGVTHDGLEAPLQRPIVDDWDNGVRRQRRHDAEADGIKAGLGSRFEQRIGSRVEHGEVGQ